MERKFKKNKKSASILSRFLIVLAIIATITIKFIFAIPIEIFFIVGIFLSISLYALGWILDGDND